MLRLEPTLRRAAQAVQAHVRLLLTKAAATPYGQKAMPHLLTARSCTELAYANLTQHRARLFATLGGVAVALFLLLLQIAVLDAARVESHGPVRRFQFRPGGGARHLSIPALLRHAGPGDPANPPAPRVASPTLSASMPCRCR